MDILKVTNRNILKPSIAVGLILLGLPIQLCTRTERAVRKIIVFLRL